jgi:hypothetical protein
MDTDSTCESAYQYGLQDQCIMELIEAVWNEYWPDTQRILEDGEIIRYQGHLPGDLLVRHTLPSRTNFPPVSWTWRYPNPVPLRHSRLSSPYPISSRTNCCASPNHRRSVRDTERDVLQPRTHCSSNAASSTRASGTEANPIVISDDDEVVSDEETPSDMIRAEVDWYRRHRTDSAGNLWSVELSEDGRNDFDYGDMENWDYNNEVKAAW